MAYELEKISKEQNLKGFFTRKMLDEMKENPEQKEEIESKYLIRGQVMAAKPAPKITDKNVADIPVVIHRD